MPGLILKLAPGERFVANGVVIENGDRRAKLNILTPDSNILRLRDALHPDEAKTPVRRVCYIIQLLLAGEVEERDAKPQIRNGVSQLGLVFTDDKSIKRLERAERDVASGRYYPALRALRSLLPLEKRLIEISGPS